MPIHDWAKVDAGIFHHFHQGWTMEICNALNAGLLPTGYFALAEQVVAGPIPDVITLKRGPRPQPAGGGQGGRGVAEAPPKARFVMSAEVDVYAGKANRVVIRHTLGQVVAVVEVLSPGNKRSVTALRSFVGKSVALLRQGINLLIVDLFPPSVRDPQGIRKAIWDEIQEEAFALPEEKPLTVVAYAARPHCTAYVEPVGVGDRLPELPIFLEPDLYVPAPLEATYQATWDKCPEAVKEAVVGAG